MIIFDVESIYVIRKLYVQRTLNPKVVVPNFSSSISEMLVMPDWLSNGTFWATFENNSVSYASRSAHLLHIKITNESLSQEKRMANAKVLIFSPC